MLDFLYYENFLLFFDLRCFFIKSLIIYNVYIYTYIHYLNKKFIIFLILVSKNKNSSFLNIENSRSKVFFF